MDEPKTSGDVTLPEPKYGSIYILQKNGEDSKGKPFPLLKTICTIGRGSYMDIRVNTATVSEHHCSILVDETTGEAHVETFNTPTQTELNDKPLGADQKVVLHNRDVIGIGGRKFRFEYKNPDFQPRTPSPPKDESDYRILTPILKAPVGPRIKQTPLVEPHAKNPDVQKKLDESLVALTPAGASKRVSFGPYLSPEQFDKTLPPATPVKKGATPRRTMLQASSDGKPAVEAISEEHEDVTEHSGNEADDFSLHLSDDEEFVDASEQPTLAIDDTVREADSTSGEERAVVNETLEENEAISATVSDVRDTVNASSLEESQTAIPEETENATVEGPVADNLEGNEAPAAEIKAAEPDSQIPETVIESAEAAESIDNLHETFPGGTETLADVTNDVEKSQEAAISDARTPARAAGSSETPKADYSNVTGIKRLMRTPKPVPQTPKADYTNVEGVQELLKTPAAASAGDSEKPYEEPETPVVPTQGKEELLETPVTNTGSASAAEINDKPNNVASDQGAANPSVAVPENFGEAAEISQEAAAENIQAAEESPKKPFETSLDVAKVEETPQAAAAADSKPEGVEELVEASGTGSPAAGDAAEQLGEGVEKQGEAAENAPAVTEPETHEESAEEDRLAEGSLAKAAETDILPTEESLSAPETVRSERSGVKVVLPTPIAAAVTPKANYTNVKGVKELLKTPGPKIEEPTADQEAAKTTQAEKEPINKSSRTPKADYSRVSGVKRLLRTPKAAPDTPKADYTDVEGVKELLKTPAPSSRTTEEAAGEPGTVQEAVDESNEVAAAGTETPEAAEATQPANKPTRKSSRTPKADYSRVSGVKKLLRTPKAALATAKADYTDVEGVKELLKTPAPSSETAGEPGIVEEAVDESNKAAATMIETPEAAEAVQSVKEPTRKSSRTPKADYSRVSGVQRLLRTPKAAPGTPQADYSDIEGVKELLKTPAPSFGTSEEATEEPGTVQEAVDESNGAAATEIETPQAAEVTQSVKEPTRKSSRTSKADFSRVSGVQRLLRTPKAASATPKADYTDVGGVKELLKTPAPGSGAADVSDEVAAAEMDTPKAAEATQPVKELPKRSSRTPKADYSNVEGVKELLKTPAAVSKVPVLFQTEELFPQRFSKTPRADYSRVSGARRSLRTPAAAAFGTPDRSSNQDVSETPKSQKPNVDSLKEPLETPAKRSRTPATNGKTQVDIRPQTGARSRRSSRTSKQQTGEDEAAATPAGVSKKQAAKSDIETPKADYTNVAGVKRLLRTPRAPANTPEADYTKVSGVKRLLRTPKSPQKLPQPDYSNVAGVKRLFRTPKSAPGTPEANYTNVSGVKRLLRTPKEAPKTPEADYSGIAELFKEETPTSTRKSARGSKRKSPVTTVEVTSSSRGRRRKVSEETATTPQATKEAAPSARSTRKRAAVVEVKETDVEPKQGKPVRGSSKRQQQQPRPTTPLDDVELLHQGKGHAARIHEEHLRSEDEDAEPAPKTRRTKRGPHVHFEREPSPAKNDEKRTRTRKNAAATDKPEPTEEEAKPARRSRNKQQPEEVAPAAAEQQPRKGRARRGKAEEPKQDEAPAAEQQEQPKKTRAGREKKTEQQPEDVKSEQPKKTRAVREKKAGTVQQPDEEPAATGKVRSRRGRAAAADPEDEKAAAVQVKQPETKTRGKRKVTLEVDAPVEPAKKTTRTTRKAAAAAAEKEVQQQPKVSTRSRKTPAADSPPKRSTRTRK